MTKDHVAINRSVWEADAENWVEMGERHWNMAQPIWGSWGAPETDLGMLPADMSGMCAIELGCGTGYVAAWMWRRGAKVTAIDVSARQLDTARRLALAHSADIDFLEGNAEQTGLPDATFDFAISEYGAAIWCPPEIWLREAWRLLRPGGRLVFLGNHPLAIICTPLSGEDCDRMLHRPYRTFRGADWTEVEIDPSGICFNLTFAGWIALFNEIGFVVEDYREIYAPDSAEGSRGGVAADWAKEYPFEQVWYLKKPEALQNRP